MDNDTNDKLNETLGKMGVMEPAHSASSSGAAIKQSSDKSFYLIMVALIVCMGFYVSYDMDQRYGLSGTVVVDTTPDSDSSVVAPLIVDVDEVKPLTENPATDTAPEVVDVEKVVVDTAEQQTLITTPVGPIMAKSPVVPAEEVKEETNNDVPVASEIQQQTESVASESQVPAVIESVESEIVSAPVVEEAATMETTTVTETSAPAPQQAPAYDAYGYPYGRPYQGNYYQQQPYRNPYYYQNRNPYGYGYNPYQQPAVAPAE